VSVVASGAAGGTVAQLVQVAGALCVPAAFAAAQFGVLSTRSRADLVLNLVGSAVLAALAAADRQLGFLLLQGVWALVSAGSLMRGTTPDVGRPGGRPVGVAASCCGGSCGRRSSRWPGGRG
jgi:hypothetical protein